MTPSAKLLAKTLLAGLLAVTFVPSLAGCGGSSDVTAVQLSRPPPGSLLSTQQAETEAAIDRSVSEVATNSVNGANAATVAARPIASQDAAAQTAAQKEQPPETIKPPDDPNKPEPKEEEPLEFGTYSAPSCILDTCPYGDVTFTLREDMTFELTKPVGRSPIDLGVPLTGWLEYLPGERLDLVFHFDSGSVAWGIVVSRTEFVYQWTSHNFALR